VPNEELFISKSLVKRLNLNLWLFCLINPIISNSISKIPTNNFQPKNQISNPAKTKEKTVS
jgi:hypothetical protein